MKSRILVWAVTVAVFVGLVILAVMLASGTGGDGGTGGGY
jgi:hypothetical protein